MVIKGMKLKEQALTLNRRDREFARMKESVERLSAENTDIRRKLTDLAWRVSTLERKMLDKEASSRKKKQANLTVKGRPALKEEDKQVLQEADQAAQLVHTAQEVLNPARCGLHDWTNKNETWEKKIEISQDLRIELIELGIRLRDDKGFSILPEALLVPAQEKGFRLEIPDAEKRRVVHMYGLDYLIWAGSADFTMDLKWVGDGKTGDYLIVKSDYKEPIRKMASEILGTSPNSE
jgi:hypothetical protein